MHAFSRRLASAFGALALLGGLAACDNFEDNLDFVPGDSRTVVGESSGSVTADIAFTRDTTVVNGDTTVAITDVEVSYDPLVEDYYVQAFTITQNYTWSVSGPGNPTGTVRRDGEYYDVSFNERGTYTVAVNDGTYSGELQVTVDEPPAIDGCIAQPYNVTAGQPVSFDAIVASRIASTVSVDFGADGDDADDDADTAEDVTLPVTYTYDEAGTYTATLTAENADGDASCTVTVDVEAAGITIGL
jgi:PKD repeat protein